MKKILLFLMCATIIFSCKKEEEVISMKPNDAGVNVSSLKSADVIQKEYRLDDVIISEAESFLIDPSTELVIKLDENLVSYNRFTNEEKRNNWLNGKPNGHKIVEMYEKGKFLNEFAESIGIIENENNGLLMAEYKKIENALIKEDSGPQNKLLIGSWYKGYTMSGANYPTINKPFFGSAWNNNISSVAAIGGATIYYDKTFYKTHMYTIWHVKNYFVSFYGMYMDNRTSSALVTSFY